jgi:AcrR family transcriptional regulator
MRAQIREAQAAAPGANFSTTHTKMELQRRRGRPRTFDRSVVLGRAMRVFWTRGYEGTSIADLLQAMRVTPPSLYSAFGSKERLFLEAIDHYGRVEGAGTDQTLWEAATAREAIENMLRRNADAYTQPGEPCGCMVLVCATVGTPVNPAVRERLSQVSAQAHANVQRRLDAAVEAGELPAAADTAGMTAFYMTVLQGMSLQARGGASRAALHGVVDAAVRAWASWC